jgi:uncharacterized protein YciI
MTEETPEQLTAGMLGKEFYVVTTRPARGPGIRELLPAHLDYQVKLERDGVLFGAGPLYEEGEDIPFAGMIVLRAASYEAARALADEDPLHAEGVRHYTIRRWRLNEGTMSFTLRFSDQSVVIAD